ncbi:MAG: Crp/Fnr family transcriptional regulator [Spirochaetota bacterium]
MSLKEFRRLFPQFTYLAGDNSYPLSLRNWDPGEYVCRSGEIIGRLFFLLTGRTRIFTTLYNGREFLYRIYHPGSIIGDIEYFLDIPAVCSVQCIGPVTAASVPSTVIRSDENGHAFAAVTALGAGLAAKLKANSLSEAVNSSYPAGNRLAAYFLSIPAGQPHPGTLTELAGWLGTSYRHLLRLISRLAEAGAVTKSGKRYLPGNRSLLEKHAGETLWESGAFDTE